MKMLAALTLLTWLTGVCCVGVSTHLRSGLLSKAVAPGDDGIKFPQRWWSLDSAAVDSTQILSPAELEEAEETSRELPQSVGDDGPAHAFDEQSSERSAPKAQAAPWKDALKLNVGPPKPPASPAAAVAEILVTAPSVPVKEGSYVRTGNTTAAARTHLPSIKHGIEFDAGLPSQRQAWTCNPPCLVNRGICNDNVCFCKSPYAGTTCQHEVNDNTHVPIVIFIFFTIFMFLLGLLASHLVFAQVRDASEKRMADVGGAIFKQETWTPSQHGAKKKTGKPG